MLKMQVFDAQASITVTGGLFIVLGRVFKLKNCQLKYISGGLLYKAYYFNTLLLYIVLLIPGIQVHSTFVIFLLNFHQNVDNLCTVPHDCRWIVSLCSHG